MTESDLSDAAQKEWCQRFKSSIRLSVAQNTWAECRRRAEVLERRVALFFFRYDEPTYCDAEDFDKAWKSWKESQK